MANIVVTSTTNAIKVVFNDMSTYSKMDKGTWRKESITAIHLTSDAIELIARGDDTWRVNLTGTNALIVDSIDGVAPSSLSDLYDKLVALIS